MAKRYKRNNYINFSKQVRHTSDRVGDWYENAAGTIYKITSCRFNYDGERVFKICKLGSSKNVFELNEFELKKHLDLLLLKKFNKWSYV